MRGGGDRKKQAGAIRYSVSGGLSGCREWQLLPHTRGSWIEIVSVKTAASSGIFGWWIFIDCGQLFLPS